MFFGPQEKLRWARDAVELPRMRCGGCSTIELGRHIEPATGVEPITCDNPQLRPIKVLAHGHKRKSGQESDCGIARCAESCTTAASDGPDLHRYRRVHENPQSTAR